MQYNPAAFDTINLVCVIALQDAEDKITVDKHTTTYPDGEVITEYDITVNEGVYATNLMLSHTQMQAFILALQSEVPAVEADPQTAPDYIALRNMIGTPYFRTLLDQAFSQYNIFGAPLNDVMAAVAARAFIFYGCTTRISDGVLYLRFTGWNLKFPAEVSITRITGQRTHPDAAVIGLGCDYMMQLFIGGSDAIDYSTTANMGFTS